MEELYSDGPVWARMKLSTDQWKRFSSYKPGTIWSCGSTISSDVVHVVKLVGWGSSGGQNCWIGWNPWGPAWGDNGYFLIDRIPNGSFHFGIQSAVWAATPNLVSLKNSRSCVMAPPQDFFQPPLDILNKDRLDSIMRRPFFLELSKNARTKMKAPSHEELGSVVASALLLQESDEEDFLR